MEKEIPFIARLVANGNSMHVSIPSYIRQYADLNKGDLVELKITLKSIKEESADSNLPSAKRPLAQFLGESCGNLGVVSG